MSEKKDLGINVELVDRLLIGPSPSFINKSSASGIVLFSSAILAMVIANSTWSDAYHAIWKYQFVIGFDEFIISKDLHHWINDGLMAVFFFVVGLELKREIIGGELSDIKSAVLPISAAVGGMVFPALIYLAFNQEGAGSDGWGIPMATDIAFSLGVLYLLGDRVPVSIKVFLTALAITDDLGAVLVIAFFYSSDINFVSLGTGAVFLAVLWIANVIGVRNTIFYALIGIGGLWLAFLMSGVHATIAAVLAAFAIPARTKVKESHFAQHMEYLVARFKKADPNKVSTITKEQLDVLQDIRSYTKKAITPLQRLEDNMHPLVAFVIMPIFAFSNAGVTLAEDFLTQLVSPVAMGIMMGLLLGKIVGVVGVSELVLRFTSVQLPKGMNKLHLWGVGFLAAIGFTMSLFIAGLAFRDELLLQESKLGILLASLVASILGYFLIKKASQKELQKGGEDTVSTA
ncbi:MAG TPA: Na+/H+ antiporter NhaA [Cyclobacteriaceae bacterium]|nr:Na+/H+ antiporter NhaA [Cyclobacteriaceae bacterium]